MNKQPLHNLIFILLSITATNLMAQCDIQTKTTADGSLFYSIKPVNFYTTKSKNLSGGIVTDKEYYYIILQPYPFPEKTKEKKITDSLEITLATNKTYKLEFYYSNYTDSTLDLMYAIDKNYLSDFSQSEVVQVNMNLGDTTGLRIYDFKLHKSALKEQLSCLMADK